VNVNIRNLLRRLTSLGPIHAPKTAFDAKRFFMHIATLTHANLSDRRCMILYALCAAKYWHNLRNTSDWHDIDPNITIFLGRIGTIFKKWSNSNLDANPYTITRRECIKEYKRISNTLNMIVPSIEITIKKLEKRVVIGPY